MPRALLGTRPTFFSIEKALSAADFQKTRSRKKTVSTAVNTANKLFISLEKVPFSLTDPVELVNGWSMEVNGFGLRAR